MKAIHRITAAAALAALLLAGFLRADVGQTPAPSGLSENGVEEQVRHALVTQPFYSLYDELNYAVNGSTVTLTGKVLVPALKSGAEAAVKRVPGVSQVVNQIEVLPLSPFDNQVRRAVYLTLFSSNSPLFRYGLGADPSIHILVENGHVTLTGTVASAADKITATQFVSGLFGVFSVTNNLTVS
jgi:osmotically-inducible protein OsmY